MNRAFLLLILLTLSITARAAVKTWDGGGADANWQTAANWANDVAPVAGDDLVFPASAAQFAANNNFFLFTSFNSITIEGGSYTLNGNPLRLANGLTATSGTHTINTAVSLSAGQTFTSGQGSTLTIVLLSLGSFPLTIAGDGITAIGLISGSGAITKTGLGAGAIVAATGYSGQILINDGIFVVDASISGSAVTINGPVITGTLSLSGLGGTGTVGAVTVTSGGISAGTLTSPTGILNIAGGLTFGPNGAYLCKVGGSIPGASGHDQLNVTGTVTIGNAPLFPLPWAGFVPVPGDTYLVLKNDGSDAINGTFLDLPEGAVFAGPLNTLFKITYHGGDGNDVAINVINKSPFDYDADGRSDISVFRPSTGAWYLQRSSAGFFGTTFGVASDRIVPADYDGDGRTDIAVFRPAAGLWYVTNSSDNTVSYYGFGIAEDIPTPADYDGDGRADLSVFRPSTGIWYRLDSLLGTFVAIQFGATGDRPTVGDFDGDGMSDLGVFRPSTGAWYQTYSSNGFLFGEQFGISSDRIAPADYDGDRKTDIAIYRPSEGLWYVKNSVAGTYTPYVFGLAADIAVPADYDGDGKADIAVFRPSDGTWYIVNSSNGSYTIAQFGQSGDRPTESAFRE